ncbi:MAG: hypothetical protein KKA62_04015 [Nanoarchaeota archaeon]|nr:hypothetical protein [Nanoarchaeota archaeon]MBU1643994.1 hypothetical protein [Nanoarchaeota archaeon]MBU1977089.1 hypothetical protein [Nanoarchaeota archaeon]
MEPKKTREELIQEAMRCEDRVREEEGKYHYGWALERAAEKWEQAGDKQKAREYYIKAAENVKGYANEVDELKGCLYEKAGELVKAAECYYEAIDWCVGGTDLHGDSKPGEMEANELRKRAKKLLDKGLPVKTLREIIIKEDEKKRAFERSFYEMMRRLK